MTRQNWGMASKMASIDLFNSSTSSLCFFFVSILIVCNVQLVKSVFCQLCSALG